MFNLGPMELVVIGAAALLILGPKRLPELAKSLGKGIRDFKKALEGEEEKPQPPHSQPHQNEQLPPANPSATPVAHTPVPDKDDVTKS